jgi:ABC-type branched-subunit amino acid transport system substrate-binding protein
MINVRNILALTSVIMFLTVGVGCEVKKEPIKMGTVLRLSIGAEHGIPSRRGVEMAVAEVNKAGGINGRPSRAYSVSKHRDNSDRAASTSSRIARNGWSTGIRVSNLT